MERDFGDRAYHSSRSRAVRNSWRAYQEAKRRGADPRERKRLLEDWRARVHVMPRETGLDHGR